MSIILYNFSPAFLVLLPLHTLKVNKSENMYIFCTTNKKSYPEFCLVVYQVGFLICLPFKSFDISSPCNQNFLRRIKTMLQQIYDEKDVELLRIVQRKFLLEPSKEDQNYNLVNPDPKFDTSMGQAKAVRQILKDKVSTQ